MIENFCCNGNCYDDNSGNADAVMVMFGVLD